MTLRDARRVADTLMYEGYVLYPYRASSAKNRMRWQFGVAMPPSWAAADPSERSDLVTECLAEQVMDARLEVQLRFLQIRRRAGDRSSDHPRDGALGRDEVARWDETRERQVRSRIPMAALLARDGQPFSLPVRVAGGREGTTSITSATSTPTVTSWTLAPLQARLEITADVIDPRYGLVRVRVAVRNRTPTPVEPRCRDDALPHALVAAHALLGLDRRGRFLSLQDPPEWAAPAAAACAAEGWWPCLAGPPGCEDVVLAGPIIVSDHPELAPESPGEMYDATEIDEILTLRTLALTDDEKREVRATDPRAAAVLDRVDTMPAEILQRLHGAVRSVRPVGGYPSMEAVPMDAVPTDAVPLEESAADPLSAGASPWWDPEADASVSPSTDSVEVDGVAVRRGSRVRLRPGRAADAQDMFLTGRTAVVEAVLSDVDGVVHLALTPEDDPAADLVRGPGRFLFFAPDEVQPLGVAP
jgi:hypothetical protein